MSIEQQLIRLNQSNDWQQALQGLPYSYWHSWQACRALSLEHDSPFFLYLCHDTNSGYKAACVYAERKWQGTRDIYTPAGFAGFVSNGTIQELKEYWQQFVSKRSYVCGYFALHPLLSDIYPHSGLSTNNNLYILDIRQGIEGVLKNANRNVRRTMRKWQESGPNYIEDRKKLTDFLVQHYEPFMRRKNASAQVLWCADTLRAICSDPAVWMVGAMDQHGICIVHAFAVSASGAECLFNINIREGRQYTTAMICWCVERLGALSTPWLNLGGGVVAGDAVAKAKEHFRPQCLPFYSAREIYDEDKYQSLCKTAGKDMSVKAGFFPGYRSQ